MSDKPEELPSPVEGGTKPQLGRWIGFGVAAGIGSAAVAAALLYSGNLRKKPDRK